MAVTRTLQMSSELPDLRDLLLRLGPDDRALRFGNAAIEAHCRRLAQAGDSVQVIGAYEDGELIGAAEIWFEGGSPPPGCEVGIEVDEAWRGHRVGGELLGRAVLVAGNRRARRLRLSCHAENRLMQRLARRFARDLRFDEDGAEADVVLPRPSSCSIRAEATMDA